MMLKPLLAPFTDKGKEVSTGFPLKLTVELKLGTGGSIWDQWGSVLRPVLPASVLLLIAA